VRVSNHRIRNIDRRKFEIEFSEENISSYSGLELFRRYFYLIGLHREVKKSFRYYRIGGDYGICDVIFVFMAMFITGCRRLRDVEFIKDDPLVKRLCGLERVPGDRSLSRYLKRFTSEGIKILIELNSKLVFDALKTQNLSTITLDMDGTVLSCGNRVEWAFRGYNPHNRHASSYYPLLCHIGETGHFLRVHNRPGNVHDSKGALRIIREIVGKVKKQLSGVTIQFRLDAAFFKDDIIKFFENNDMKYAIKIPLWPTLPLKEMIKERKRWKKAGKNLSWFSGKVYIKKWDRKLDVVFYRKKLSSKKMKEPYQLDLFSPDDGIYEYEVICSNKEITGKELLDFYNGRCAMEHDISELKQEFAFDSIPTKKYQANSTYLQISALAYNLVHNFQQSAGLTKKRQKTSNCTVLRTYLSLRTIRFMIVSAACRMVNLSGKNVIRMPFNKKRENIYNDINENFKNITMAA
jgi:hypothetical protein